MVNNSPTVYNTASVYTGAGGVYNDVSVYKNENILLYSVCNECIDNKDIPIIGNSENFTDYEFLNPGYKFWGTGQILYKNLDGLNKFIIRCKSENYMDYSGGFRTPFRLCICSFDSGIDVVEFRQKFAIWVDNVEFNNYTTSLYRYTYGNQHFFLIGSAGITKEIKFIYNQNNEELKVIFDNEDKITFYNIPRTIFNNSVVLKNFTPTVSNMYLYELFASK